MDPEEAGPGRSESTLDPGAGTLFSGGEGLEAGQGSVAPNPGDLRSRAEVALGGHAAVEGSSIDEGAPWPAEGGVLWVTGEGGLDGVAERVVDCVKKVSQSGGVGRGRPFGCRVSLGPTAHGSPGADRGVVRASGGRCASSDAVGLPGGAGRLQKGVRRLRGRSGDGVSVGACRTHGGRRERSGRDYPYRRVQPDRSREGTVTDA